jgi:hypothetical protein
MMQHVLAAATLAATASAALAGNVTPGVIFGSGNANGGFTIASANGIELGLRGKVRYNANGVPENNWNQVGNSNTYRFNPNDGVAPGARATWNWEWSINSNVDGTGANLDQFCYELTIYELSTGGVNAATTDLINNPAGLPAIDHSFGNNSTTAATDTVGNVGNYATLIATSNVAQNSSNFAFLSSFFAGTSMDGWTRNDPGTYVITLAVFENNQGVKGAELVSNTINIQVVPLPPAAFAGLGLLGTLAGVRAIRRR